VVAGRIGDKAVDHPPGDDMTKQDGRWNPDLVGDYDRIADLYTEAYADDLSRKAIRGHPS
jgi:hypothetical protein